MALAQGAWTAVIMNSGATDSTSIDLGRVYDLIQVDFPAMNSCSISLKASRTSGGTYNALGSSVTANIGTGSIQDVYKLGGHQFIQLTSSVVQNSARTIYWRAIAT